MTKYLENVKPISRPPRGVIIMFLEDDDVLESISIKFFPRTHDKDKKKIIEHNLNYSSIASSEALGNARFVTQNHVG